MMKKSGIFLFGRLSQLWLPVLAMLMMLCLQSYGADDELLTEEMTEAVGQAETEPVTRLTVGNPTAMKGYFFTGMWGNDTADIDVRRLLHGYDLIMFDKEKGLYTYDPSVVSGFSVVENETGDRTYIFVLYDDLYYADGTKITAWDYAFSYLLQVTPQIEALGGVPEKMPEIAGYETYLARYEDALERYAVGEEVVDPVYWSGIRVTADDTFMITVDHTYLPYFFELGRLRINPYPIHMIAPGVEVRDMGRGVYLADIDDETAAFSADETDTGDAEETRGTTVQGEEPAWEIPSRRFTADLLEETILDDETGYLSHPTVSSGPYVLTDWDGESATFAINPYYKGNRDGEVPSIDVLTYTLAVNETMVGQLERREFDLLNKVTYADTVTDGMLLLRDDPARTEHFAMSNYPRTGLSFISFVAERTPVDSLAVRQAIAWCMDREQITRDYTGNYGLRVDGFYGLGQWMYRLVTGAFPAPVEAPGEGADAAALAEYEAQEAGFAALSLDGLTTYSVDVEQSIRLLEDDGWYLEKDGDGIRQKQIDGETVRLELSMAHPAGSTIASSFEANLIPYLEEAGIRLTLVPTEMEDLLEMYDCHAQRDVDMLYLATDLDSLFDPAKYFVEELVPAGTFTQEDAGASEAETLPATETDVRADDEAMRVIHRWKNTGLVDEDLYLKADALCDTQPGDILSYMQKWVSFQERFNEVLPMIPIYSNVYFDFYTDLLHDYPITASATWGEAIVPAWLGETEAETESELLSETMAETLEDSGEEFIEID